MMAFERTFTKWTQPLLGPVKFGRHSIRNIKVRHGITLLIDLNNLWRILVYQAPIEKMNQTILYATFAVTDNIWQPLKEN
jgi:hypothetical protein